MRAHNNTAVVQLFCFLSQTAGSLRSGVFEEPSLCHFDSVMSVIWSNKAAKGWLFASLVILQKALPLSGV